MKEEYDFSRGERGRFYHKAAEFDLPHSTMNNEQETMNNE